MRRDLLTDLFAIVLLVGALAYLRGYRVRVKAGVVMTLAPEMDRALPLIELAHQDAGIGVRKDEEGRSFYGAFYTSGNDGAHKIGSLHYLGRAVDLRTKDLAESQSDKLVMALRWRLPVGFDVVDERSKPGAPHIHVEWDPK